MNTSGGTPLTKVPSTLSTLSRVSAPRDGSTARIGLSLASSSSSDAHLETPCGSDARALPATLSFSSLTSDDTAGIVVSLLCAKESVCSLVSAARTESGTCEMALRSSTSVRRLTHRASSSGSVTNAFEVSVSLCRFTSVPMDGGRDAILLFEASTLRHLGATSDEKILAGSDVRRASRKPTMPVVLHAFSRCDAFRLTF